MDPLFRIVFLFILLALPFSGQAQTPAQGAPSPMAEVPLRRLEGEILRAAQSAGGTVGMSAIHIESGRRIALKAQERFPMASTYKVPIAVQLLTRVDQKEIRLDRMIEVKPNDLRPGSGVLTSLFNKPGVALSVRNLLELMLLISDNSATDLLLRLAGGPEAVTARMRALGVRDMEIHRPTGKLLADAGGYSLPPETEWTAELFNKLSEEITPEVRKAAAVNFEADLRDTTTPDAMAGLLERICRQDLLQRENGALLLDIMERCRTGEARLKGLLPAETIVAHKTGTIGRTAGDVGIIKLPHDAGHIAIAVFVKSSEKEMPERERAIAQIARTAYDFFLFRP